jgi:hypothetical protein
MAGIDTPQEHSIFEYRPALKRNVPPPDHAPDSGGRDYERVTGETNAILLRRGSIIQDAIATDALIDEVEDLIDKQTANLNVPVSGGDDPDLLRAVRQLGGGLGDESDGDGDGAGGAGGAITSDMYKKALTLLRNAATASMCVDPVQMVFANQGDRGPMIPAIPTRTVTCEEAADPNLFASLPDVQDEISAVSAMDQRRQVDRYNTLKLTWFGLMQFVLKSALRAVERIIRALRKTWVLRPIARIFKRIAQWLRFLICWSEQRVFGRYLSDFCKKGKNTKLLGFEDDLDNEVRASRRLCFTSSADDIGNPTMSKPDDGDCVEDDTGFDPPGSRGCPIVIPQDCVDAAQQIVDAIHHWAVNASDDNSMGVNPIAIMIQPALLQIVDIHENGKFSITSQDQSTLSDELRATTARRPLPNGRWNSKPVKDFTTVMEPNRTEYSEDPLNPNTPAVTDEECD